MEVMLHGLVRTLLDGKRWPLAPGAQRYTTRPATYSRLNTRGRPASLFDLSPRACIRVHGIGRFTNAPDLVDVTAGARKIARKFENGLGRWHRDRKMASEGGIETDSAHWAYVYLGSARIRHIDGPLRRNFIRQLAFRMAS